MKRRNTHGRIGHPEPLTRHQRRVRYARQRGYQSLSTDGTVTELRARLRSVGIETPKKSKVSDLVGLITGYNEAHVPTMTDKQAKRLRKKALRLGE